MNNACRVLAIVFSVLFNSAAYLPACAEEPVFPDSRTTANEIHGVLFAQSQEDAAQQAEDDNERMQPWKVAMISAVVPGYGQIYNGAIWKVPILYGLLGYFGYTALDFNDSYDEFRVKYAEDPEGPDASYFQSERDRYQEKRNRQLLFLVLAYIAGIVDAYVDAHLYDFDAISEEGISSVYGPDEPYPSVSVSLRF